MAEVAVKSAPKKKRRSNGQGADIWRRLRQNKKAVGAMIVLAFLLFLVVFANLLIPYGNAVDINPPDRLQWPNAEHWFGTDHYGRDIFARIIYGARVTLLIGFGATAISALIGTAIGTTSAYLGGKADAVITRILDTWMAIPSLLVTLALIAGIGRGLPQTIAALAVGGIPGFSASCEQPPWTWSTGTTWRRCGPWAPPGSGRCSSMWFPTS